MIYGLLRATHSRNPAVIRNPAVLRTASCSRLFFVHKELERQILNAADFYLLGCNMTEEAAEVSFNGIM